MFEVRRIEKSAENPEHFQCRLFSAFLQSINTVPPCPIIGARPGNRRFSLAIGQSSG